MNNDFPKISIITPTLNQGKFIKKTIDSVLEQGYPNYEYVVVDGGSTDGTIEILKSYGSAIKWISEKDGGQADAINKGIKLSTGEIIGFINSDDFYLHNVFVMVADFFKDNPDIYWYSGNYFIIDDREKEIQPLVVLYKNLFRYFSNPHTLRLTNYLIQPSTFWRRSVHTKIGLFDSTLRYAFDYDFWVRLMDNYPHQCTNTPFSAFRIHNESKGGVEYKYQFEEENKVLQRYRTTKFELSFHIVHNKLITAAYNLIK